MSSELVSLRDARERAIAVLEELFANDALELDEFDRRLTVAHRAGTLAELEGLFSDFPDRKASLTAPAPQGVARPEGGASSIGQHSALVPVGNVPAQRRLVAIMGGVVREGQWTCPRQLKVTALMGGAVLDFREARLGAGVTEIHITTVMGGAQIIVPPGLSVEIGGTAIMGGFAHMERTPPEADPDRPSLRIDGFALMGGVHVETRLPGENEHDAHRRRRRERKELRAAARSERRQLPAKSTSE